MLKRSNYVVTYTITNTDLSLLFTNSNVKHQQNMAK